MLLLVSLGWRTNVQAVPCNTFVKQINGAGTVEPRIFKDPNASSYFLTSRSNDTTFISGINSSGTLAWTHIVKFPGGDQGTITDMIVDPIDGTLAAVVRGVNFNYMFKYDYTTATMNWLKQYPNNYIFQNIHETNPSTYVVTGEILSSQTTIFQVDRNTGSMSGYQNAGFTGEFFSTYDGTDIYGACRYYTTGSLFNPSLYRYDANTGNNVWTNTYIRNAPTVTCRIYPVAPIVDQNEVVQLSSGDDINFNTYTTGPTKIWLLKTDLAGNLNWTDQIGISGVTQPNVKQIINTATGYYLLIDSYNGSIINCFYVVKTDKAGNIQWANRYGISGQNTVISGVEDNGYLLLTATSGSYSSSNGLLLLKLDANGMSDASCGYIKQATAKSTPYANTQVNISTMVNGTSYADNNSNYALGKTTAKEAVYCSTSCQSQTLPCNTLTGTLASGVMAFYPFGFGSLADVSGNNNNLTNPTTATPTLDRSGNGKCAYHFEKINGDFLTIPAAGTGFLNGLTTSPFSISLWYQPTLNSAMPRNVGDYELLIGRGTTGVHCPDTWGEWSIGLYDCRKAVAGLDMYSHWEGSSPLGCAAQMAAITNNWHHLVFTYDGISTYNLYVDGNLYTTASGPCGAMSGNIGPLMLGKDYTGDLDDIIIYNRVLSTSEVATLKGLKGSCCDGSTSSQRTTSVSNTIQSSTKGIKVYPNPTNGNVTVSVGNGVIRSVSVYNSTGATIGTYHFNTPETAIDLSRFASGIYFLKVVTDSGSSLEKIIKE